MGALGGCTAASLTGLSDDELVSAVRDGDDGAFEELYRRYSHRVSAFVRGLARDDARAEDITQDAFFSALRRLRATDSEIAFKPWIYEIARNAAIDSYRRTSRAEEVSMDADEMRPSDRGRLVGPGAPDSALIVNERMRHLRGALDELSETHHRILVMRELEGLSYREIGERLELTRPAVESTLFRARRRLEREYEELDTGRRCQAIRATIAELAEGVESEGARVRVARHAGRCNACRRMARQLGIEPLSRRARVAARAAALLPLPMFLRRSRGQGAGGDVGSGGQAAIGTALGPGMQVATALGERVAALVTAAALAGAGGIMVASGPPADGPPSDGARTGKRPAVESKSTPKASTEIRLRREAAAAARRQQSESVRDARRARARAFRRNADAPPAPRPVAPARRTPAPTPPEVAPLPLVEVKVDPEQDALGRERSDSEPRIPTVTVRVEPVPPPTPVLGTLSSPDAAVDRVEGFTVQAAQSPPVAPPQAGIATSG